MRTSGSRLIALAPVRVPFRGLDASPLYRFFFRRFLFHEPPYDHEDDDADDQKVEEGAREVANSEFHVSDLNDRGAPVAARSHGSDDRHDQIGNNRGHKLAHGASDDHRNREADDAMLEEKRAEFSEHVHTSSQHLG